jgi:hypothetical protein
VRFGAASPRSQELQEQRVSIQRHCRCARRARPAAQRGQAKGSGVYRVPSSNTHQANRIRPPGDASATRPATRQGGDAVRETRLAPRCTPHAARHRVPRRAPQSARWAASAWGTTIAHTRSEGRHVDACACWRGTDLFAPAAGSGHSSLPHCTAGIMALRLRFVHNLRLRWPCIDCGLAHDSRVAERTSSWFRADHCT